LLRYALVGLLATAIHYLVLVMLVEMANVDAGVAAGIGALCGALAAYAGNRRYTFLVDAPHRRALPRFLAVAATGVATSAAFVAMGTLWLHLPYLVPQAAATLLVLVGGYTLNRRWSFA